MARRGPSNHGPVDHPRWSRGRQTRFSRNTQSDWTPADIQTAEAAMQDLGQTPLFMITDKDPNLDQALATAGYDIVDPVNIYSTSVDTLTTERPPKVSMFSVWPPLAIEIDMWAEGGISDARVNVMKRVQGPKTSILARWNDHPAGVGFAAVHGKDAFVHAVEIRAASTPTGCGQLVDETSRLLGRRTGGQSAERCLYQGKCGGQRALSFHRHESCGRVPL